MEYTYKVEYARQMEISRGGFVINNEYPSNSWFESESGEKPSRLTPEWLFKRNIEAGKTADAYNRAKKEGILGKWTGELDDTAELYWTLADGKPSKFLIVDVSDLDIDDLTPIIAPGYFMEIDGNIVKVQPEEGDRLFDTSGECQ